MRAAIWSRTMFVAVLVTIVALAPLTGASAFESITGSTTRGTVIEEHPGRQLRLENIIGQNIWGFEHLRLDGVNNRVRINLPGISQEFDFDTGGGSIAGDLGVVSFGVASTGYAFFKRNYVFIRGSIGGCEVELQLDYTPGMGAITSASVKENVAPTRCHVIIKNPRSGKQVVFDDYPGQ